MVGGAAVLQSIELNENLHFWGLIGALGSDCVILTLHMALCSLTAIVPKLKFFVVVFAQNTPRLVWVGSRSEPCSQLGVNLHLHMMDTKS